MRPLKEKRTVKFRPWYNVKRVRVNETAPLTRKSGGPYIPNRWKPKDDADEVARMREFLRFLAYFDSRVNRFLLTW